jgi:hypothetical protein
MIKRLPVFMGYTVDVRLKEFRRVDLSTGFKIVPFNSEEGEIWLNEYIETIDENAPEGREILVSIW